MLALDLPLDGELDAVAADREEADHPVDARGRHVEQEVVEPPGKPAGDLGVDRPRDIDGMGGDHQEGEQAAADVDLLVRRERVLAGGRGAGGCCVTAILKSGSFRLGSSITPVPHRALSLPRESRFYSGGQAMGRTGLARAALAPIAHAPPSTCGSTTGRRRGECPRSPSCSKTRSGGRRRRP